VTSLGDTPGFDEMPRMPTTPLALGMTTDLLTLAAVDQAFLISLWKPILFLAPFVLWARLISSVLDKHAARFFLARRQWNLAHIVVGFVALVAGIAVGTMVGGEGGFFAGLVLASLILAADLFAYMQLTARDERVPAAHRLKFKLGGGPKVKKEKVAAEIKLALKQADEKGKFSIAVPNPKPETPELEVRTTAEKVVLDAIAARASRVEVGPVKEGLYGIKQTIDGVITAGETMPPAAAGKIMDFWKSAAKQDVADRRRKQTSDVQMEQLGGGNKVILRVTSSGAQGGMRVAIAFDPDKQVTRQSQELGLLDMQLEEMKAIASEQKGVVLVATPTGAGRTTLMYALVRMHDSYTRNVQTVETEPQGTPEGVRCNKFDPAAPGQAGGPSPEFSTFVRSVIRRDPDVLAVSELPDPQTAKEIAKADKDRTRTYVAFKNADALTAVQTWVKAVGETRQAADALFGVVIGKLPRKLCTNCRVAYPPTPDMLRKLGLPEGKVPQLFKKGGQVLIKNKPEVCPMCRGNGYFGAEGVYEVYSVKQEERDLIAQGNYQGLKAAWRKRGLVSLQQAALRKAVDGVTSVEEVMRISTDASQAPASPAPVAAGGGGGSKE
jgi:type II secretory ATPase GspE/PulE/Tfp pilus assembly ATPase PilB-like protein